MDDIALLTKLKKGGTQGGKAARSKDARQDGADSAMSEKDQQISILNEIVLNQKELNSQLTEVLRQKQNDIEGLEFFISKLGGARGQGEGPRKVQ